MTLPRRPAAIASVLAALVLSTTPTIARLSDDDDSDAGGMTGAMTGGMSGGMTDDMTGGDDDDATIDPDALRFFEAKIRPVLIENCHRCHAADAERIRGDFLLDTRDAIRRGGPSGPGIVPFDVDSSMVIRALRWSDGLEMPPKAPLPDEVIRDFERWVAMGAPDPRTADETLVETPRSGIDIEAGRAHWAFRPPVRHAPPAVEQSSWPLTEIDRFTLAAMEAHGLEPVRDAERDVLIRRLTFDLLGLPPTPEAIDAFVKDRAPDAYERLVDRLLASPRFGERWGRHWLDVARYAESTGKEQNVLYPHAWRYRDYVIASFNADKPYDEFVREQIAGDLLPAETEAERAEHLVATGYLAVGTKSLNTRDRRQFALDVADEQIDALTQGLLGMTVACARCHDHKFDPIPTSDYYAMAGIFLSTETRFGAQGLQNNRNGGGTIALPAAEGVANGPAITAEQRQLLERQRQRAEAQREQLLEQTRSGNARETNAAARLRQVRQQLQTIDAILGRYDADGAANDAARVAMGAVESRQVRDARILVRGELDKPGDTVPRGFVQVISDESTPEIVRGSGRRELAEWIASPANPLVARVWVNRVWSHLFGTGLVPTPDNFGTTGQAPTHPELLDTLAVAFMEDDGWSTKTLVRRLVTSRTYRLGSWHNPRNAQSDPDTTWLWRMRPRRLEAEAIRDAMLAASGALRLDPPLGSPVAALEGPVQIADRTGRLAAREPVRSVYLPVIRDRLPESLDVFDFAEPSFVTGAREVTNVPSQALFMLNSDEVMGLAAAMADRLLDMPGTDRERARAAFRLAYGREPSGTEIAAVTRFFDDVAPTLSTARAEAAGRTGRANGPADRRERLRERARQEAQRRLAGGADDGPAPASADDPRRFAWAAFCQSLFASAEFRTLE